MLRLTLALTLTSMAPALTQAYEMDISTAADVQFPDYRAKPWIVIRQDPVLMTDALNSSAHSFHIGTSRQFSDNPDTIKSKFLIFEISLLGNGPSIRAIAENSSKKGKLYIQVKVDGYWWTIPSHAKVVMDLINNGATIVGVPVYVYDRNENMVKSVIFFNKNKK